MERLAKSDHLVDPVGLRRAGIPAFRRVSRALSKDRRRGETRGSGWNSTLRRRAQHARTEHVSAARHGRWPLSRVRTDVDLTQRRVLRRTSGAETIGIETDRSGATAITVDDTDLELSFSCACR